MSYVLGAETTFPENRYTQKEMMDFIKSVWPSHSEVIERLKSTSGVNSKNLLLPLEQYKDLGTFEKRNKIYIEKSTFELKKTILSLQEKYPFDWNDLQIVTSTTVTGIAVPTLDARLMNQLPIPKNVIRLPLFGLGCLGGIAGLNRTVDLLKAYPKKLALLLATEACSLTFQFQDVSMANMVATSLFGDGSAAVLLAGDEHPLANKAHLKIKSYGNEFYPDSEKIMGWDILDTGFKVVLSGDVANIVKKYVGDNVRNFLSSQDVHIDGVKNIISHPGGPKVLMALSESLGKSKEDFKHSWESLSEQGNMSSVSVLDVLKRHLEKKTLKKGYALGIAMGPGFNSEMNLWEIYP
jgi:alkylresorcinol/alkylpyrone synthase